MHFIQEVADYKDYLAKIRRFIHEHPEVSGEEYKTVAFILNELKKMGITCLEVENGGVLGFINGRPGKTVLLRADIDALPIQEDLCNLRGPKVSVSRIPGVSHACGHDAHTAMLLTEAKILQAHKSELPGSVVLCFERGEEGTGNLKYIIEYLEQHPEIKIDTCFATHVRWDIPSGKIAVVEGAALAGAFGFDIRIQGCAGHGARPDLANSPIDCFVAIYNALNTVRMKQIDPFECLTFSVGTLTSGSRINIVPEMLEFSGTARFFSSERAGEPFIAAFKKILCTQADLFGCTLETLRMKNPLHETRNHPICAAIAREAVAKYVAPDALADAGPWMASETFGKLLKLYPGVMVFTGIKNDAQGSGANHHTPEFDVDEEALLSGIKAALGYTLAFMARAEEIPFERSILSIDDLVARGI